MQSYNSNHIKIFNRNLIIPDNSTQTPPTKIAKFFLVSWWVSISKIKLIQWTLSIDFRSWWNTKLLGTNKYLWVGPNKNVWENRNATHMQSMKFARRPLFDSWFDSKNRERGCFYALDHGRKCRHAYSILEKRHHVATLRSLFASQNALFEFGTRRIELQFLRHITQTWLFACNCFCNRWGFDAILGDNLEPHSLQLQDSQPK